MFEKKIKATSQFVELPVSALENVVGGMKIQRDNTNPNSNKDRSNTARQNLKQISSGCGNSCIVDDDAHRAALERAQEIIASKSDAERGSVHSIQNRVNRAISNLDSASENLSANETRIEDVDMAKEMQNYTQNQLIAAEQAHNRVTVNSEV